MNNKKFIPYSHDRDILFVFGAGTSIADGSCLQKEILPRILELDLKASHHISLVKKFINSNFYININRKIYPSLESIFGYLDYFILKNESLGGEFTTTTLRSIKEYLIKLIHHSISQSNTGNGTYKKFCNAVEKTNKNISIITTNYDTLLDEAFDSLYPNKALIDYCIKFLNYTQYDKINSFNWWVNSREPVSVINSEIPTPIKIIKLHGSLNWKYCNCCNQVLLTPWDTEIDVDTLGFKELILQSCEQPEEIVFDLKCPNDNNQFNTFIIPPSHIKELNHPIILNLFDEAAYEIRIAKKIIFIGYSLPEADIHIKALFKKNLTRNTKIEVINRTLTEDIRSSFMGMSNDIEFIEDTFENYIEKI